MYYIIYPPLYLLSLLPLRVLHFFSDILYFLVYTVFGYRKKVVLANLAIAFPNKSEVERKTIARKFYRNFIDNFIEAVKLISAKPSWIADHFSMDVELMDQLQASGKRMQLHLGHMFNWEFACVAVPLCVKYKMMCAYLPIGNKAIDRIFYNMRSKTGCIMIPSTDMKNAMLPYRNMQYSLALVADQAPGNLKRAYWLNFFGRPTPFLRAPEKGAQAANIPVAFITFYKIKRGYYYARTRLATENPQSLPEGEITRIYARYMEEVITENPDMYLWSHRRWKHPWKEEYQKMWVDATPAPN